MLRFGCFSELRAGASPEIHLVRVHECQSEFLHSIFFFFPFLSHILPRFFSLFIYKTKIYSFSVELCVLTNACNHVTAITTGLWNISPSDFTLFSLLILVSTSSIQTCKGLIKSVRDYHQIAFSDAIFPINNMPCNTVAVSQSLNHG